MGGADSSASVELTGAADPLRLSARHELDLVARTLHVSFVLYNRLPGEVAGATVRCGFMSLPLRSEQLVCFWCQNASRLCKAEWQQNSDRGSLEIMAVPPHGGACRSAVSVC